VLTRSAREAGKVPADQRVGPGSAAEADDLRVSQAPTSAGVPPVMRTNSSNDVGNT